MLTLSLKQPWANALFSVIPGRTPRTAAKEWETRSWKPTESNLKIIQTKGLLIHASKTDMKKAEKILTMWPFDDYVKDPLLFSAIIGWVRIGEVISTEAWRVRHEHYDDGAAERPAEEFAFGNYDDNRFAWKIEEFIKFDEPILNINGSLSLWKFPDNSIPSSCFKQMQKNFA